MVQERVTRLETQVESMDRKLETITNSLDAISKDLAKYKGAWGMLVMIGGAVVSAVTVWTKIRS